MGHKLFLTLLFLVGLVGVVSAQTPPPTPSPSPSSTPTPGSQIGYKPRADWYGYTWYTQATLPNPPGAGYGTVALCIDCTKTNPPTALGGGIQNNPPIPCTWVNQWDCSGGLVSGRCIDLGTVTSSQIIVFTDSSCKRIHTATTGLAYWLQPPPTSAYKDLAVEIDSYIAGAITGPLFLPLTGSIKWLNGTPPVSSGINGYEDILYLKWDGTNFVETGEMIGLH